MSQKLLLLASVFTSTVMLAACEHAATLGDRPSSAQAAAQAQGAPQVLDQRIEALKADLPRRLARKPKHERDAVVALWQQSRLVAPDPAVRFDQPQSAQTFFLEKRLPGGQTALSVSLYEPALRQAARMPVYSSAQQRMLLPAAQASSVVTRSSAALSAGPTAAALGNWEALGPGNIGGRTRALVVHPTTPDTMWAGAVAGGIWKTTNGGTTWVPKADLLINIAVNSMVIDPSNPNVLYAGTGEGFFNVDAVRGAGILKSTDGGETWARLAATATPDFFFVQKMVMNRNGTRLYAATRTGVFRSLDGGGSWTRVLNGAPHFGGCMDLAIQTDRALASVYAACGSFAQAGFANGAIYRALDNAGTQTWTQVFSPANMGRTTLAIAPSNQNVIYAMAASNEAGAFNQGLLGVFRSTTSGSVGSWTTRVNNLSPVKLNTLLLSNPVIAALVECGFGGANQFLNQGWYDNTLAVDPADPNIVWAGGIDLFRSNDGGANWGQASHWWFGRGVNPEYNHADHHIVVFHPGYNGTTNRVMFSGNDGGLFKTADARAPVGFSNPITPATPICGTFTPGSLLQWSELNNGYQVTQFYHGVHYPDGTQYFGGTQDNGTLRGTDGAPNAWVSLFGGDGGYVAINPLDTNMLWEETTGLSIRRSTNGGASWSLVTSGVAEGGGNFLFIVPFAQDPSNPNRMWIGGAFPWRADAAAAVPAPNPYWTQAGAFFGSRIGAWAVAPQDSNRVYAGTGTGGGGQNCRVFTTGVAGTATAATVWASAKVRSDNCFVSWIAADPGTLGTLYATVSTFNAGAAVGHVFKSTDFGATWASIDGSGATGIPDVPVHTIVVDPANTQTLYVGTDIGVFVSTDGGANWARENTDFANVIVEALSLKDTVPRQLFAFTHGRSLFRVNLP